LIGSVSGDAALEVSGPEQGGQGFQRLVVVASRLTLTGSKLIANLVETGAIDVAAAEIQVTSPTGRVRGCGWARLELLDRVEERLLDGAGASIWSLTFFAVGYLFSEELERMLAYVSRMGSGLLLLVVALFVLWIGWKFIQRRRFLRQLDVARITPEELRDRLSAGEDLFIVDLRSRIEESPNPIPGARSISPEDLAARSEEIPRDRDIILFCS
jgi:hypothetical protein